MTAQRLSGVIDPADVQRACRSTLSSARGPKYLHQAVPDSQAPPAMAPKVDTAQTQGHAHRLGQH